MKVIKKFTDAEMSAVRADISGFLLITSQKDIIIVLVVIFFAALFGWFCGVSTAKKS